MRVYICSLVLLYQMTLPTHKILMKQVTKCHHMEGRKKTSSISLIKHQELEVKIPLRYLGQEATSPRLTVFLPLSNYGRQTSSECYHTNG